MYLSEAALAQAVVGVTPTFVVTVYVVVQVGAVVRAAAADSEYWRPV